MRGGAGDFPDRTKTAAVGAGWHDAGKRGERNRPGTNLAHDAASARLRMPHRNHKNRR